MFTSVQVSSATLKDGSSTVSGQLQVVSGVSKTLTCETSVSRPAATIVWYIGTQEKQRSTSKTFTFKPQNSDHSKQVYCNAFNTQPESQAAVTSYKSTLNVQVQVSSVTLKDGSSTVSGQLQVVSGVSKTLTCETSVSRPAATIVWYIGTQEKQRSTSKTFTFNPQNSYHSKQVYCKAFNTQPESQAVISYKSTLYVTVYAATPTLTNKTTGSMILLENDPITMECITSATRPAATVTWWKGSSSLTNINNTNINKGNLISVKSVVSFTPRKVDNRKVISCQSVVSGQDNRPSAQQTITVYWPPATPSIPTSEFPFLENQTGRSIYCSSQDYGNPASTARWNKQYGTPDNSDSRRLNLPTMTSQMDGSSVFCQLDNNFTQVKGSTIKSPPVKLEVEYNPITHIMVDGIISESVTRNEGQTLSALCNATGNPTPTVKWIGQSLSSSSLLFHDIDRNNHGRYTCRAEATSEIYRNHDFVTETIIDVIVNYPPNVSVLLSKFDPAENISLQISCHATGRPAKYTFTSMVQTWRGIRISNTHLPGDRHFNGIINIPKLTLEDSGTYTCHVNNGISDRYQQLNQIGKTDVSVKVSPKVLLEDGYIFVGAPGKSVNITIPFFSYPAIKEVNFQFQNGTVIRNSNKYTISYTRKNVTTKFYDQTVELEGYIAILRIEKEEQKYFVNYTLLLKNGIGEQTNWNIHHISESVPLAPTSIYYTGYVDGFYTFLLIGNFNGGRLQTFVIETSIPPSTKWNEILRFSEKDKAFREVDDNLFKFNLTGLVPNTYILRVLAENTLGRVNTTLAPTVKFTVYLPSGKQNIDKNVSENTGAIAGGLTATVIAVIVIVVISVIIVKKRKSKQEGDKTITETEERLTYESLQTVSEAQTTYSSLSYATDPKRRQDDKIYENLRMQQTSLSTL
ncbi:synaptogenesis protein syg-2-like [Ruditapes philippinarum]|uniref:synaptogenesis protein syg-2-like n=1 Tax=Ruditapes philippinarum TaxID=129788 RepID=UPI00295A72C8|nr:synaptogenesis protein syg-2-like [Ruditapes philippinarum]